MTTPRWRRFQFGIRLVMWITVVVAICLSWWRLSSQEQEIAALRSRQTFLERDVEMSRNAFQVCRVLDLKNPTHRSAAKLIYHIGPWPMNMTERREIAIGGRQADIIVLHEPGYSIPGTVATVVALVADNRLVDLIQREEATEVESHKVRLEDFDGDGALDVDIDGERGHWSQADSFRLAYTITDKGFTKIESATPGQSSPQPRLLH